LYFDAGTFQLKVYTPDGWFTIGPPAA
jgi:hypothetical protein